MFALLAEVVGDRVVMAQIVKVRIFLSMGQKLGLTQFFACFIG